MKKRFLVSFVSCLSVLTLTSCINNGPTSSNTISGGTSGGPIGNQGFEVKSIEDQIVGQGFNIDNYVTGKTDFTLSNFVNIDVKDHTVFPLKAGDCSLTVTANGVSKNVTFKALEKSFAKLKDAFTNLKSNYTFVPFEQDSDGNYLSTLNYDKQIMHTENYSVIPTSSSSFAGFVKGGDDYFYYYNMDDQDGKNLTVIGGKYGKYGDDSYFRDLTLDISDFTIEKDQNFNEYLVSYGTKSSLSLIETALGGNVNITTSNKNYLADTVAIHFEKNRFTDEDELYINVIAREKDTLYVVGSVNYGIFTNIGTTDNPSLDSYVQSETVPENLDISDLTSTLDQLLSAKSYRVYPKSYFSTASLPNNPYLSDKDLPDDLKGSLAYYDIKFSEVAYEKTKTEDFVDYLVEGYVNKGGKVFGVKQEETTKKYSLNENPEEGKVNYKEVVFDLSDIDKALFINANIVRDPTNADNKYLIKPLGDDDTDTKALIDAIYGFTPEAFAFLNKAGRAYLPLGISLQNNGIVFNAPSYSVTEGGKTYDYTGLISFSESDINKTTTSFDDLAK